MERLTTSLQNYNINALQDIAATLKLPMTQRPARKAWLVSELGRHIPKLARSEAFISALSEAERAVLALARGKDVCTVEDVASPLILSGLVYVEGQSHTRGRFKIADVLAQLLNKGLIVNLTEPPGMATLRTLSPVHEFAVPPEVDADLPGDLWALPEVDQLEHAKMDEPPPFMTKGDLPQFLREIFFAWAELRRDPARLLKAGDMGKRDRRRISEALGYEEEPGLERVAEIYEILLLLRLVRKHEETSEIVAVDNDAALLFWSASPVTQLRDLLTGYVQVEGALVDDEDLRPSLGYYQGFSMRSAQNIRIKILNRLEQIASIGWVNLSFFTALVNSGRVGNLVLDDQTIEYLAQSLRWYGANYRTNIENDLAAFETAALRAALKELQAMGLIDLGYAARERKAPVGLRVTSWARSYYDGQAFTTFYPDVEGQVILQPDFQLLAMGPVPLSSLMNLERFAAREKIDESVVTYRITRDAVYQAFQRDESVEMILSYLEEATQQPVPQNVARSLEEWRRQYERIVVRRQVSVLQVDSADLLRRFLEDEELSGYLHALDDRTAWLRPQDAEAVQRRLRALDVLPAFSKGAQSDLPRSLRWQDGELEPRTSLPSLYVTGALRRMAEQRNGRWALSPESVQTAVALGLDPVDIIAELERMTGRALPDGWDKRIKSWGKHYGDGQVAQVRLLRMPREDALEELRNADAQLHRWLRPLPHTSNLAVVNETHWKEVVELLASWGVEVETDRWW